MTSDQTKTGQAAIRWMSLSSLATVLLWFFIYFLATSLTRAIFFGDTRAYTFSILNFMRGERPAFWEDNSFWEFGHLFWRPLGWLAFRIAHPLTSLIVGSDPRANIGICLFWMNWTTGLLSVLVLNLLLKTVSGRVWSANLLTLAFLFSQAFLNYSQTGTSYVPGQLFLLLSLYLLTRGASDPNETWLTSLSAGVAFAASICLWFLYVLATPTLLIWPFILAVSPNKSRFRLGLQTCAVAGITTIFAYVVVLVHLHLHRWEDVLTWASASSHGVDNIKGFSRMLFGFARSFINMGRDGILFKRFINHDPYNPVSLFQLFRLSLAKFMFFYSVLIVMAVVLKSQHFKILGGLAVGAMPVIGFALLWQGGDMERYLPLFPLLFMALSSALCSERSSRLFGPIAVVFVSLLVVTNGIALSRSRLDRQQTAAAKKISQLQMVLKPGSKVVLLDDELAELRGNPLHSGTQDDVLPTYVLLTPGTSSVPVWRQDFSSLALSVWDSRADVWVSKNLLGPQPTADMAWVEGDDKRISWQDIYQVFSELEINPSVASPDGFALLSASSKNHNFLNRLTRNTNSQSRLDDSSNRESDYETWRRGK